MFGKLELTYTRARCRSRLAGATTTTPYRVIAKDSSSVAIVAPDLLSGEDKITHIHFEGSTYWIHVGRGKFREFFRRVR